MSFDRKKAILIVTFVFVITSVLVTLLLSVFCVSVSVLSHLGKSVNVTPITRVYKYLNLNSERNQSSSGFVRFPFEIEGGFSTFKYRGDDILVSKFGTLEYDCEGTCYCEESRRIFAMASSITRTLTILVGAITSVVALRTASQSFETECGLQLDGICDPSFIRSNVEYCKEISEVAESKEVESRLHQYMCNGRCLQNNKLRTSNTQKLSSEFGCQGLTAEGEVSVKGNGRAARQLYNIARQKFQSDHLMGFCKDRSRSRFMYNRPNGSNQWRNIDLCVSNHGRLNPTIRCTLTNPLNP